MIAVITYFKFCEEVFCIRLYPCVFLYLNE